jgi:cell division protein ZapA
MGEVNISIHGKPYGIACDDGQEQRVLHMGKYVDQRLRDIAVAGAATNESHLLVLTALVMADEIHELREALRYMVPANGKVQPQRVTEDEERQIVDALDYLAKRIESVTTRLQILDKAAA